MTEDSSGSEHDELAQEAGERARRLREQWELLKTESLDNVILEL